MRCHRGRRIILFAIASLFMGVAREVQAQIIRDEALQADIVQADKESKQQDQKAVATEVERLIELLRQRALAKARAEEQKAMTVKAQPKIWKIDLAAINGFENNVNLDSFRKGDYSLEEDFTFTLSPSITNTLSYSLSYFLRNIHYAEQKDNDTFNNGAGVTLRWKPTKKIRWDVVGYEYELDQYPKNEASTFKDNRITTKLKHTINQNFYHEISYAASIRYYTKRKMREDPAGTRVPHPETLREDQRHTLSYTIGGALHWKFLEGVNWKVKQDFYTHWSNESYQDYYDVGDYKIKPSLSKQWNKKISTNLAASYERKNYQSRNVTGVSRAQYDDVYEYSGNVYYTLTKEITLAYTLKYKYLDSNDPGSEYSNLTNQIAMYVSF